MSIERAIRTDALAPQSGEGLFAAGQSAYECEGQLFLPANAIRTTLMTRPEHGDQLVQLELLSTSMMGNHLNMFIRMTPEGARAIARSLSETADRVEAHVADQAAAAIEKARGGAQ